MKLRSEYNTTYPLAVQFVASISRELNQLLEKNEIELAVPLEARIKTWSSVVHKLERRKLSIESLSEIQDFIGMRVIVMFKSDLVRAESLIKSTFRVVEQEDTAERLDETEFGYQSKHYVISCPELWLNVPTMYGLGELSAELQLRTLAQHNWAACSHKLQYKKESSIPKSVRRSIHRVSALLETVDLEWQRVLDERKQSFTTATPQTEINVDLLHSLVAELMPDYSDGEGSRDFEDLIPELKASGIETAEDFRQLWTVYGPRTIADNREIAKAFLEDPTVPESVARRAACGRIWSQIGMIRHAINLRNELHRLQ